MSSPTLLATAKASASSPQALLGALAPTLAAQAAHGARTMGQAGFAQALQQAHQGATAAPAPMQPARPAGTSGTAASEANAEPAHDTNGLEPSPTQLSEPARGPERQSATRGESAERRDTAARDDDTAPEADDRTAADDATEGTANTDAGAHGRLRKARPTPGLARSGDAAGRGAAAAAAADPASAGTDDASTQAPARRRTRTDADAELAAQASVQVTTPATADLARSAASGQTGGPGADAEADAGDPALAESTATPRRATAGDLPGARADEHPVTTGNAQPDTLTLDDAGSAAPPRRGRHRGDEEDTGDANARPGNPGATALLQAMTPTPGSSPAAAAGTARDAIAEAVNGLRSGASHAAGADTPVQAGTAATVTSAAAWAGAWAAATGAPAGTAANPTPATMPPAELQLPVPVDSPEFLPRLGQELAILTRDGVQEARVQLNPAELGPIAVQITLDGQAAQVHLAVDHARTHALLEQAMPSLAAALRDNGFTLAGGGVSQQSRQGGREGDNGGGQGQDGGRGTRAAVAGTANPVVRRVASGRALDLYA